LAAKPPNHVEAEKLGPGLTPVYADAAALMVDVATPSGQVLAVDDPALCTALTSNVAGAKLSLLRSDRAMTDCRPVSMISVQTIKQIGDEVALTLDKRRFRANVYAELESPAGFAEDAFVGRQLRIGARVVVTVLERDARCKMVGIDPDTGLENQAIPRKVARAHAGNAGVYCAVITEGMVRSSDSIVLMD
jgi:hypothetical protein